MTYIFEGVFGGLSTNTVKMQTVVLLLLVPFVLSYYRMNSNSTNPFLDGLQFVDPVNLNNFVPVSHSTPYVALGEGGGGGGEGCGGVWGGGGGG